MWRDGRRRARSARARLALAKQLWRWRPHPAQVRFFCDPAQVRVAACGRRWGKTECLGVDIATLALCEPGCRQLVVAPTDAQARLIGGEVLLRLRAAWDWRNGAGDPHPRVRGRTLAVRQRPGLTLTVAGEGGRRKGTGESALLFRTAGRDGRGLRGLWAHRIVVDEAAYVPDDVLTDVLLPMLLDRGGDYLLASSPHGRQSAFYRLFARAGGGAADAAGLTYAAFQFPTTDNPHLDLAFLQSQREEMGAAMFAQEYEAQFLDAGGAVFREDDLRAALQSDDRVTHDPATGFLVSDPQPGRLYTVGVDWGRKLDFTVVAVVDATDPVARLVGLWRWQGTGWDAQIALIAQLIARFAPWRVLGDGSGLGDALTTRLQDAIRDAVQAAHPGGRIPPFAPFLFTGDSKQQLVDTLTLRLSARRLAFPAHRILLSELRSFEYLGHAGPTGKTRTGARGSGHDDTVIALALAVWAAPDGAPPPLGSQILLGSQWDG